MSGLLELLAWVDGPGQILLWSGFLGFVRIGAAMAFLPALGEQVVPVRIRAALTLVLTMAVLPALPAGVAAQPGTIMAEAVNGLIIGFGFRLFVMILQMAGTFAAQATSLAQMFATAGPEPLPVIANLLVMAGLALFCTAGLHVRAVAVLLDSYTVLPLGKLPGAHDATGWGTARIAHSFAQAFVLAAPFLIGGLLYNLALGAINRAMPTLMVVLVGAPAVTAGALILLLAISPFILEIWHDSLTDWLAAPWDNPR